MLVTTNQNSQTIHYRDSALVKNPCVRIQIQIGCVSFVLSSSLEYSKLPSHHISSTLYRTLLVQHWTILEKSQLPTQLKSCLRSFTNASHYHLRELEFKPPLSTKRKNTNPKSRAKPSTMSSRRAFTYKGVGSPFFLGSTI